MRNELSKAIRQVSLGQFYDELERFDWYYDMSDDHSVWERGRAIKHDLQEMATQSPAHAGLWVQYTNWRQGRSEVKPPRPSE